jgi:DNA modification methylase
MQIHEVEIEKLNPAKYNPRFISEDQLSALSASLSHYDFVEPVVVNQRNMVIVGGHQRVKAWQGLGKSSVPVVFVDLNDAEERALNLALNKISGEWDEDKLADVIRELKSFDFDDFLSTGFTDEELSSIGSLGDFTEPKPTADPDEVPEPPPVAITQTGDVYEIGAHRLICGDSTSLETIKTLMADTRVDMIFTDPPYGVDYSSKNEFLNKLDKGNCVQKPIENDAIANYREWFGIWLRNASEFLAKHNTCYFCMSGLELHNLRLAMDDAGYKWGDYLIWVKNNHVLGRKDYNAKHEFIVYGWFGVHKFYGDFSTTVIEIDKPLKNDLHPTMKPVELVENYLRDGSPPGGSVLDLFGGSGTTMVAAQRTDRIAYLVEKDLSYCDVIVERMKALFPELPVKRNGKLF